MVQLSILSKHNVMYRKAGHFEAFIERSFGDNEGIFPNLIQTTIERINKGEWMLSGEGH